MVIKSLLLVCSLFIVLPGQAQNIIYVNDDANGANTGLSWFDAYTNLQDALLEADSTDQIWVATGVYYPGERGERDHSFKLVNGVKLYGGFRGSETSLLERPNDTTSLFSQTYNTILSGDINKDGELIGNSYTVIYSTDTDSTTILSGFIISSGNANGSNSTRHTDGGGMYNNGGTPIISKCLFTNNQASRLGAGMFNTESAIKVIDCVFSNNKVLGNGDGGGIYNSDSDSEIITCIFQNNLANDDGGGSYNRNSNVTFSESIFIGNTCGNSGIHNGEGGGIHNDGGAPKIDRCQFINNEASHWGGGIFNDRSSPQVQTCIFNTNHA